VNAWSTDGQHIFLSRSSPSTWRRGFAVYDVAQGSLRDLILDDRLYGSFQLSDNGSTVVFAASEGNRTNDLYVTDPGFDNVRRLTEANSFLANRSLSDTELISYLDVDGNELYGVIYYPTDYVPSVRYPTIFLVYERFFDNRFNAGINHLTSRGYAVVQPSVQFEQGYPGEAWLKGVTAAANKLIDMGVADPDRLGVHGTSYGGYATNLLIAQTKRFKAAINISGKVNMVSFYTDSPRIGTRNIRAPERGQDRIGATLWEQPQKYMATSAIMDADRITTPLLLLTGEQDHNVPGRQAMEMFYALRRLGQTVEWVNYINGGHGTPTSEVGEFHDYYQRILGWYDKYLKVDEAEAVVLSPQNGNGRDG
jgi:dipeptidyl aminopeptidase/acylaminoacyl peptidase